MSYPHSFRIKNRTFQVDRWLLALTLISSIHSYSGWVSLDEWTLGVLFLCLFIFFSVFFINWLFVRCCCFHLKHFPSSYSSLNVTALGSLTGLPTNLSTQTILLWVNHGGSAPGKALLFCILNTCFLNAEISDFSVVLSLICMFLYRH